MSAAAMAATFVMATAVIRSGMKGSGIEPQRRICVTCYTPTQSEWYCANAVLLTYLLNGEILLLFIRTWPSRQKRAHSDRTLCSTVTRDPLVMKLRDLGYGTHISISAAASLTIKYLLEELHNRGHPCMATIRGPATMTCPHQTGSARTCNNCGDSPCGDSHHMAAPPVGGLRQCGRRTLATNLHLWLRVHSNAIVTAAHWCSRSLMQPLTDAGAHWCSRSLMQVLTDAIPHMLGTQYHNY